MNHGGRFPRPETAQRAVAVTLNTHQRLIAWGFVLTYLGVMGGLAALSFAEYGGVALSSFCFPPALSVASTL